MAVFTPAELAPGYYITPESRIIHIIANRAGTRVRAERMVIEDGRVTWVREFGLGTDLVIAPLTPRAASQRVRAAVAA